MHRPIVHTHEVKMFVRSLVARLALIIFASSLAASMPASAGTVTNVSGKFSFWVPDDWKMTKDGGVADRSTFESADGNLSVLAGPLMDKDAELSDDDVVDFVDDELDAAKVTSDKRDTVDKFNVRLLEGTGSDNGEAVVFKMLALDPGPDDSILAVVVYGSSRPMNRTANLAIVDRILRSLRPH